MSPAGKFWEGAGLTAQLRGEAVSPFTVLFSPGCRRLYGFKCSNVTIVHTWELSTTMVFRVQIIFQAIESKI